MARFCINTPVFQSVDWIDRCLESIRSQTVTDFRCAVMDDHSTDGTFERARARVKGDDRFLVMQPAQKNFSLGNRLEGIRRVSEDPEDIVVIVDGDDWLMHDRVLERLQTVYADPDVWLTYGSHQRWKGRLRERWGLKKKRGIARPYPDAIAERRLFRYYPFCASHLRTFKRFLWDAIRDEDLRDEDGAYFKYTEDEVTMLPMLDMAGRRHIRYLHEMLYVYNHANPMSDERIHSDAQVLTAALVRARPPYPALDRGQATSGGAAATA
ncbi:MAG: glycosyltransferase family 2 protein [Planctomycetota bacterium]|jgi:glycosyltransferase involved in cell wall biosynthesis